jgi:DMSO/TMAO reductase YedYZ molybdopterin-dependent catalytic subunit
VIRRIERGRPRGNGGAGENLLSRRHVLSGGAKAAMAAWSGVALAGTAPRRAAAIMATNLPKGLAAGTLNEAVLDALPGKKPLIKLSWRPPNYETPIEYFRQPITPNDAFFVRYHLSNIPEMDAATWQLAVGGEGAAGTVVFKLDDLKVMPPAEIIAVNQCAGNRRGLFLPHVTGVEWGDGAMGCAHWKGVRLKDLLNRVGVKKEAIEIVFEGADGPVTTETPKFVKSIPLWKAMEETTLVAFEMNGKPLPHFNGFPARLIVPGWTGTYWMKHLISIRAITKPEQSFWMKSAYRIPVGLFPAAGHFASQETAVNTPITEMMVNSLITSHHHGAIVAGAAPLVIGGVAWDAGYGVDVVELSFDGGRSWQRAKLGEDLGRYAFRPFSLALTPGWKGRLTVLARASNRIGQTQTSQLIQNPAGYHNNMIQSLTIEVT